MVKYEIDSNRFGSLLRLRGKWDKALEKVFERQKISQLELEHENGWRGSDLNFLEKVPGLESLYIRDISGLDVSGVDYLNNLKRLHLHIWNRLSRPIDFAKLKCLESCEMDWNPAFESVLKCNWLKKLGVSDMKNVSRLSLEGLTSLEELWLTRAPQLKAITFPPQNTLLELVLRRIPNLCEVNSWSQARKLKRLWLTECKRLSVCEIAEARNIEKLDLFNMGPIPSLRFLENLPHLKILTLSGSTEVRDGKIAFVSGLPNMSSVTFRQKSYYDDSPQGIRKRLECKKS